MDQFERLKVDIEDSRADLQGNLRELERKVGDAADWRYQFQKRPAVLLGAAVAGGALLGMLVGPRRSPSIGRTLANESKPGSVSHSMMGDVVPQKLESLVIEKMLDVAPRAGEKIVHAQDVLSLRQQLLAKVGA